MTQDLAMRRSTFGRKGVTSAAASASGLVRGRRQMAILPDDEREAHDPTSLTSGEPGGAQSVAQFVGEEAGSVRRLWDAARRAPYVTLDHLLISLGVAAAAGSVSFAGVMLSRDNSRPMFGGVEHLMIFAQPIGGAKLRREPPAEVGAAVDFNATGSIDPSGIRTGGMRGGGPPEVKGYVLHVAPRGALLVEGPKGLVEAKPGATIPELGTILSVQNRNGRWRAVTERGVVSEME